MAGADLTVTTGRLEWLHHLARLRSSYRDAAAALAPAGVVPTLTLGSQGTGAALSSQISGATITSPLDTNGAETLTPYHYLGGYSLAYGVSGVDVSLIRPRTLTGSPLQSPPYSARFGFSGDTQFEIKLKMTSGFSFRLRIDDQWVTNPTLVGSLALAGEGEIAVNAGSPGSLYGIKVSGLDSGHHVYQIDLRGSDWFGGVFTTPQGSAWKPRGLPIRAVLLSDSTGGGAGGPAVDGSTDISVWWPRFCDLMGWEAYNASVGGTGILDPGLATQFTNRVAGDVTAITPDVVVVSGSRNDNIFAQSDIQTAAAALYTQIRSANPSALLVAMGPWTGTSRSSGYVNADTAMRAAALSVGVPFISMYTGQVYDASGNVLVAGGQWVTGTGNYSATVGTGRYSYQNFENGQTNGTTINTVNTGLGSQNDVVSQVTGSPTYDATHVHNGSQAMATGTSGAAQLRYPTSDATVWQRFYLYIPAYPGADNKLSQADTTGTANLLRVVLQSSGKLYVNVGGGTNVVTAAALPAGQWVRIETKYAVSGTTATVEAKVFATVESGTPTETIIQTGSSSETTITSIVLGTAIAMPSGLWFDDWQVNNVAYPGALGGQVYTKPGNADWVMRSDATHPTIAGHAYWARQATSAVRAVIDNLNAEAFS